MPGKDHRSPCSKPRQCAESHSSSIQSFNSCNEVVNDSLQLAYLHDADESWYYVPKRKLICASSAVRSVLSRSKTNSAKPTPFCSTGSTQTLRDCFTTKTEGTRKHDKDLDLHTLCCPSWSPHVVEIFARYSYGRKHHVQYLSRTCLAVISCVTTTRGDDSLAC